MSTGVNVWVLTGRLARDPDVKETKDGKKFIKFTLAVERPKTTENRITDFIDCMGWGDKMIDPIMKYAAKGSLISVVGSGETSIYNNKAGIRVKSYAMVFTRVTIHEYRKQGVEVPPGEVETLGMGILDEDNLPF